MTRAGTALIGVALALATDLAAGVPGRDAGVVVALVAGLVLVLAAPRHRCHCRTNEPAPEATRPAPARQRRTQHRPDRAAGRARPTAVSNVVALAGEPGTGDPTDPGLGELRPVRPARHARG